MNIKLIDCTLRDGGYHNNWDFDFNVVIAYLKAVSEAKIDYVELGLRNFPQDNFLGPFAYTTESLLNSLDLPDGPIYGVMIDAKTILSSNFSIEEAVDKLFVDCSESKIDLVRVAAHFGEVDQSEGIIKSLKEKGYIVGFNMMQAGGKASAVIEEKAELVKGWGAVDVLYFADSFGNMNTDEVKRIAGIIQKIWPGEMGIHTHNNMAKALDNTLAAIEAGVNWLDVTITGMGRGAGNAQTENLLAVLSKTGSKYVAEPVYELVIRHFEAMQKQYGWGSNLLYFIGAQNDIHPTYVQNLLTDGRYGPDETIGAINYLSKASASTYTGQLLEEAISLNTPQNPLSGDSLLENKFTSRELLIIGSGPSVKRYKQGIVNYIQENKPIVIAININSVIDEALVDYYCISHNSKFLAEKNKYKSLKKPLILPKHRFTSQELKAISSDSEIYDYGLEVAANEFKVQKTNCTIPHEVTAGYAMAISLNGNASAIKLVGFDGYESRDTRQAEMVDLIVKLHDIHKDILVEALTPTTYPIKQKSIYAPNL